MARIYDNIENMFSEGLEGFTSNPGVKRVDFCVGYFNLRGWKLIWDEVEELPGAYVREGEEEESTLRYCRLLVGMHQPDEELVRRIYNKDDSIIDNEEKRRCQLQVAKDFRRQVLLGIPSDKDKFALQQLYRQMKEGRVSVRLFTRYAIHAKLYLFHQPDAYDNKVQAIMGSSNLTYSGLTRSGELDADFGYSENAEKFARWFTDRWEDKNCIDITNDLIQVIEESWASPLDVPPYYVYLKTAYNLSQDARSGIKEFVIDPIFKKELFEFQSNAVTLAARHLNNDKRGGAMIGDVVGLGKTITACAIAKIFENTYGASTLIICPANLQEMWDKYKKKYNLKADIMSLAKPIDVEKSAYYRLVIVDESHNLRNSDGKRYRNIRDLIHHLDSKVLLLTATPYNKDYSDLSNQLRLFLDDDQDLGIRPENLIAELGGERAFINAYPETELRSIKAFEHSSHPDDWNALMKLFLVRRTRTFIKKYYTKKDETNGRQYLEFSDGSRSYFPTREPKAIKFKTSPKDQYSRLYSEEMVNLMKTLKLPRYGLSNFIDTEKFAKASRLEKQLSENLSRAGQRMMGFCLSTMFKRIDSSGYSFLLTLYRHILRNMVFVYAIDNKLPLPIGDENTFPEDYTEDRDANETILGENKGAIIIQDNKMKLPTDLKQYEEKAKAYYELISQKNNLSWISSTYFKRTLKQQLKKDCETLIEMIKLCGDWIPSEDPKLNKLAEMLSGAQNKEDKVIVFTQYSDTAEYVCQQLKKRGIKNVDCATGGSQNPTEIVTKFSPKSNEASIAEKDQTRVLIATDVLSEGQNLQDAHVIVNFDLPWAIIRLIQRAGRVDRIGQKSEEIFCYSFFPTEGVEKMIKLKQRLNNHINTNANVVGSDEIFFEGNEQNLQDMFNEKSGILDDEDDGDVDMASYAYQIWQDAISANPRLKTIIPKLSNAIYSTKLTDEMGKQGVITYAKTYNDYDVLSWLSDDGSTISNSQRKILDAMRCSIEDRCQEALSNHFDLVEQATNEIKEAATASQGIVLGNRFSTRFRVVQLLDAYYRRDTDLFYTEEKKLELKLAIDDIYNNPLLETAKFSLGRLLRSHTAEDDIVDFVLELRKTGGLCRIEENAWVNKDPSIICSMGLRYEGNK